MSAPQTNLEKQERWHRGPLIGMAAVIVFVGVMFLWLTGVFSPVEKTVAPVGTDVTAPATEATPDATQNKPAPPVPADN